MSDAAKSPRPGSYDPNVVFCFELMRQEANAGAQKAAKLKSYQENAIFVVHGIGAHSGGVTAVQLRDGFEDALNKLKKDLSKKDPNVSWSDIPATYLKEGYWGDYDQFGDYFPALSKGMTEGSREFFAAIWKGRSTSAWYTAKWFAKQALRLPGNVLFNWSDSQDGGKWLLELPPRLVRFFVYCGIAIFGWMILLLLLLLPKGRKILARVLADVRMYLDPCGAVEQAIVQSIDRRVRDLFLQMLGVDADFHTLPDPPIGDLKYTGRDRKLNIGGEAHAFDRVTWVAHSLGTVVSYNVISDILNKCKEIRGNNSADKEQQANRERVEKGLHHFYTIGSPLRKIAWLYPGVLRNWPHPYLAEYVVRDSPFWVNFRHIWDPVSGHIGLSRYFSEAIDSHSPRLWTLPGYAHLSYWNTAPILQYIVSRAQPQMADSGFVRLPRWPQYWLVKLLWHLSMLALFGNVFVYSLLGLYRMALWMSSPKGMEFLKQLLESVLKSLLHI
jgi:hypothetical protein